MKTNDVIDEILRSKLIPYPKQQSSVMGTNMNCISSVVIYGNLPPLLPTCRIFVCSFGVLRRVNTVSVM